MLRFFMLLSILKSLHVTVSSLVGIYKVHVSPKKGKNLKSVFKRKLQNQLLQSIFIDLRYCIYFLINPVLVDHLK